MLAPRKRGLALRVRGRAGWLEVFSQIVEVDTLLLPAPPSHLLLPLAACLLCWLAPAGERERERDVERKENPSSPSPPVSEWTSGCSSRRLARNDNSSHGH